MIAEKAPLGYDDHMPYFKIAKLNAFLQKSPKLKAWVWFVLLWLGGLATVIVLSYPLKLLIRLAS